MKAAQIYTHLINQGDTCLDIGANVGQTAKLFSPLVGKNGKVFSFECHPKHFSSLAALTAAEQYNNTYNYCTAMADQRGFVTLYFSENPQQSEASTIEKALAFEERLGENILTMEVPTETVDNFCTSNDVAPAFIKVDVEGAEEKVFAGSKLVLEKYLPNLLFEYGIDKAHGFSNTGHLSVLKELDYTFFLIDVMFKDGQSINCEAMGDSIISSDFAQLTSVDNFCGNVLAIHERKDDSIKGKINIIPFDKMNDFIKVDNRQMSQQKLANTLRKTERLFISGVTSTYMGVRNFGIQGARSIYKQVKKLRK